MTTVLSPLFKQSFLDNNGAPLYLGKLWSYSAGTLNPLATFTDSTGVTSNTNPIVLNPRGEADVWIPPNVGYKFALQDSLGNAIWTIDNVINTQLITLYGGVDTGTANAYVLNFSSSFTGLTDGILVYWIASNTNTGPSTLNVNALGPHPILNQQTGLPVGPGQIVGNGVVGTILIGGSWFLTSSSGTTSQTGTFQSTPNAGDFTAPIAPVTVNYTITGKTASMHIPYFNGISASSTLSLNGLPTVLVPSQSRLVTVGVATNNSAISTNGVLAFINGPGSFQMWNAGSATGWTNSGTKGLGTTFGLFQLGVDLIYSL